MASLSADDCLKKCGAIMYDVEIISAVPQRGEVRNQNLHYCGGWEDYEGMGISVITAYDFVEEAYRIYLADNMCEFRTLVNSRSIIIGFNSDRFDNNVCKANRILIDKAKSYDLWKSVVKTQPQGHRRGFSLNDLLKANGLETKSGLGSDAPRQAQMGLWGELINYCLDDTRKQVQILRLAINGTLKNPNNGSYMIVAAPWEVVKVETGGLF